MKKIEIFIICFIIMAFIGLFLKVGIFYNPEPIRMFYGKVISHEMFYNNRVMIRLSGQESFRYEGQEYPAGDCEMILGNEWCVVNTKDEDVIDLWFDKRSFIMYVRVETPQDLEPGKFGDLVPFSIIEFRTNKLKRYLKRGIAK